MRNVSFGEAIALGFRNYANFKGRAQRAEFWWWVLFTFLGNFALTLVDAAMASAGVPLAILSSLFSLGTLVPNLSVAARRLHDIGRSGWWQLIPYGVAFLSVILVLALGSAGEGAATFGVLLGVVATLAASIVLLVWYARDSDRGTNRFGPSPKYGSEMAVFD